MRQQQPLGGDELVAGLLGDLLGLVEDAGELGRQIELAGAAARNLRPLGEQRARPRQRILGAAASLVDQPGGQPLIVVEQHFQQVLGAELLVAFAQRKALRRLDKALGAVGIAFEIHGLSLISALRPPDQARGSAVIERMGLRCLCGP